MFAKVRNVDSVEPIDPITYLVMDIAGADNDDMLKLKRLEHTFGLKPTNDLAVIRLMT